MCVCVCVLVIVSGLLSGVEAPGIELVRVFFFFQCEFNLDLHIEQFREGIIITFSGKELQESITRRLKLFDRTFNRCCFFSHKIQWMASCCSRTDLICNCEEYFFIYITDVIHDSENFDKVSSFTSIILERFKSETFKFFLVR